MKWRERHNANRKYSEWYRAYRVAVSRSDIHRMIKYNGLLSGMEYVAECIGVELQDTDI